jgi:hypothetical protein
VVFRGFAVVLRGALVVIGGFPMMLDGVFHDDLPATIRCPSREDGLAAR